MAKLFRRLTIYLSSTGLILSSILAGELPLADGSFLAYDEISYSIQGVKVTRPGRIEAELIPWNQVRPDPDNTEAYLKQESYKKIELRKATNLAKKRDLEGALEALKVVEPIMELSEYAAAKQELVAIVNAPEEIKIYKLRLMDGTEVEFIEGQFTIDSAKLTLPNGGVRELTWFEVHPASGIKGTTSKQMDFVKDQIAEAKRLSQEEGKIQEGMALMEKVKPLVYKFGSGATTRFMWKRNLELVEAGPLPEPDPAEVAAKAEAERQKRPKPAPEPYVPGADRPPSIFDGPDPIEGGLQARIDIFMSELMNNPSGLRTLVMTVGFGLVGGIVGMVRKRGQYEGLGEREARMELEEGILNNVKAGMIGGILMVFLTLAMGFVALLQGYLLGALLLIDVVMIIVLTVGIHYRSRIASTLMVLYFLASRFVQFWQTPETYGQYPFSIVIALGFLITFIMAMGATFRWHALDWSGPYNKMDRSW